MRRPWGITLGALLLHILNLLTMMFPRWDEPDSFVLVALVALYVCFTAIVIHAFWKGQAWARWVILIRCVFMLGTFQLILWEGGIYRAQGIAERILALALLVYLSSGRARAWFASVQEDPA